MKTLRRGHFSKARGLVLDVAAGTGKNLPHYPAATRVVGIDLSLNMLLRAREKSRGFDHSLVMDAEHLAFRDATFDTVGSALSLCSVPDPVKALQEIRRVAKQESKILLLEHGLSRIPWVARIQHRSSRPQVKRLGCHPDRDHLANLRAAGLLVKSWRSRFLDILIIIDASKNRTNSR